MAHRRLGLIAPGSARSVQTPPTPVKEEKAFKIPSRFEVSEDDPPKKSVMVSEDDECPATQEPVDDEELDMSEDEEDPEGEFREHAADVLHEHGLEQVKGWFTLEYNKAKKALKSAEKAEPPKKKQRK
nr:hypothetical protein [Crucivirus sp.]